MALAAQAAPDTSTLDATNPQATVPVPAPTEDTKTSLGHSGGPLDSHPTTIVPQRTSSTTATSLRHSLSGAGPITPPRRSSRRYNSVSSGDWFAGGKKSSTGLSPRPSTSQKDNWQTSDFSWTAFTASKSASRRMEHVTEDTKPAVNGTGVTKGSSGPSLKESAALSVPPPLDPPQDFGDDLIFSTNRSWSARKEKTLLGPFDYMYGHPGKDIRAQLISAFNAWLQVPEESLQVVTKVVGMLHTASLLVDDVEDSSQLRRGIPVSHSIFGIPQTLNSANYVYFLALNELTTLPHSTACIQIYTDELINLHRGQGMDLFWRDTLTCPTESDYLEMVSNKTGGLFRLAIKLMAAESGLPSLGRKIPNVLPLIQTISLYFQILDDLLNLSSSVYTSRKGLCEDLTEGKFSFPVIHAVRSDPSNTQLINILRMKTTDEDVKRYAVGYMEQCGSFKYTRGVLAVLEGKVNRFLEQIERDVGGDEGKRGADGIRAIVGKLKSL